jgi:hypothetical protein
MALDRTFARGSVRLGRDGVGESSRWVAQPLSREGLYLWAMSDASPVQEAEVKLSAVQASLAGQFNRYLLADSPVHRRSILNILSVIRKGMKPGAAHAGDLFQSCLRRILDALDEPFLDLDDSKTLGTLVDRFPELIDSITLKDIRSAFREFSESELEAIVDNQESFSQEERLGWLEEVEGIAGQLDVDISTELDGTRGMIESGDNADEQEHPDYDDDDGEIRYSGSEDPDSLGEIQSMFEGLLEK